MRNILFLGICEIILVNNVLCLNIITNGDFESGNEEPWVCNGCHGNIDNLGYNNSRSYFISDRKESWSGPQQMIDVDNFSLHGNYKLGYKILVDHPAQLNWKLKVI